MTRAAFILLTVGAEVERACGYLGDNRLFQEFQAAEGEMELWLRVDIVWWSPDGERFHGGRYDLSLPGTHVHRIGPDPGPYAADQELPPEPGWTPSIVAFMTDDDASRYAVAPGGTKRSGMTAIWAAMGARVFA